MGESLVRKGGAITVVGLAVVLASKLSYAAPAGLANRVIQSVTLSVVSSSACFHISSTGNSPTDLAGLVESPFNFLRLRAIAVFLILLTLV